MKSLRKNELYKAYEYAPACWLRQQLDWGLRGVERKACSWRLLVRYQRDASANSERSPQEALRDLGPAD
jgi:hypothetical protein